MTIRTEPMTVNVGPQHPTTHGVFRLRLTVDGEELSPGNTVFRIDDVETTFSEVSKERTFTLAMNRTITIIASGKTLESGPHKIGMGFDVPGLGTLRFDFTDVVGDE